MPVVSFCCDFEEPMPSKSAALLVPPAVKPVARDARMTESIAGARFFWGDPAGVENVDFLEVVLRDAVVDD
jgi:hypothetical protein